MKRYISLIALAILVTSVTIGQSRVEYWDDFDYSDFSDPELEKFGWDLLDRNAWPAPGDEDGGGLPYSGDNILFLADKEIPGNKIMSVATVNKGTLASRKFSRIETIDPLFFEGTYAARVKFTDENSAKYQDGNIQTFYTIFQSEGKKEHSEHDFEYLPYDTWMGNDDYEPTMYVSSHDRYDVIDGKLHFYNDCKFLNQSYGEQWHLYQFNIYGGIIKYYIDGELVATHDKAKQDPTSSVYPDSKMQICFANWITFEDHEGFRLGPLKEERENKFFVDWVYHAADEDVLYEQVVERVAEKRAKKVSKQSDFFFPSLEVVTDSADYTLLDFDEKNRMQFEWAAKPFETVDNPKPSKDNMSKLAGKYVRNAADDWDAIVFSTPKMSSEGFEKREMTFLVDVYTDAIIGTPFLLTLEDGKKTPQGYPNGRRCRLVSSTRKYKKWHTMEFSFDRVISDETQMEDISRIALSPDAGSNGDNTFYFDNFRWVTE